MELERAPVDVFALADPSSSSSSPYVPKAPPAGATPRPKVEPKAKANPWDKGSRKRFQPTDQGQEGPNPREAEVADKKNSRRQNKGRRGSGGSSN